MGESNSGFRSDDASTEIAALIQDALNTAITYQHQMAERLFDIACLDGLDKLSVNGTLPASFLGHFQKVMQLFDESIRYSLGQLRDAGFTAQCRPGCDHCCCQMPTGISTAELIFLYHGMQQSGAASKLFRRCLEAEELWVEVCHRQANEDTGPGAGQEPIELLSKSYGGLERPCPFLQAHLCQLYPYRPIACRMHFSLSPAHWCRPSHFQNTHALRFNLEPGKRVFDALEKLEDRLKMGFSDVMICGLLELTVNVMRFEKIRWVR